MLDVPRARAGHRRVGGPQHREALRLGVRAADASGNSDTTGITVSAVGGVLPGDLRHYQLWYRDPAGSPCGSFFNLTNGYSIQW